MTNDTRRLALLVVGLFVLESILILLAPIPWLLGQANADDFYYYLVLAKHSAAGLGPTFDGFDITNGFHPLYLLLLIPLALLPIQAPAFLIKAALLLLLLFHTFTGLYLTFGFWRLGQRRIGWLMALAWLLNPWALAITLHGVEVPIATALWAIITLRIYSRRQQEHPLTGRESIILGILIGLTILARTDSIFLAGAVFITELYRGWRIDRRLIWTPFLIGVVAFLLTLPWWWWNWQTFGAFMQVSGKAVFFGIHGVNWQRAEIILPNISKAALLYFSRLIFYNIALLVTVLFVLWTGRRARQTNPTAVWPVLWQQLDFALIAIMAIAGWYVVWQWHIQNWYLLSTTFIVTMIIGAFLGQQRLIQTHLELMRAGGLIVFVNLLILFGVYSTFGFGFPRQARGYYIAEWLNQALDAEAPVETRLIGVWNSGIVGYFSHHPVINLDGVVNNQVYHYKVTNQVTNVGGLMGYIQQRGISYLTDYEQLYFADPAAMGLEERYVSPDHDFRIYKRIGD